MSGFTSGKLRLSPFIGVTGTLRSETPIFAATIVPEGAKLPIRGPFTIEPDATREESRVRLSIERTRRIPSALARTLIPLSLVDTASNIPSLLNRTQGEAGNPPSASMVVKILTLSMSQNLMTNSSPAARNLFRVVSNWTTPTDLLPRPTYDRLTAPSLSFHSTRKDSPSLFVPQEKSLVPSAV
uniref:Uncharacterized protein n=1 Tax=Opuntia streptacantha TaxID=393608 RepID=A0A7C8ZN40_OPUST